jgi:16S rRNA (guanine527-N7)-methyltransferase
MNDPEFARLLRETARSDAAPDLSDASDPLAEYLAMLWKANQELNLVSRKMTPEELVIEHLMDCLIALPHLPAAKRIADLGSGGGLPAVALAICRPETHFTLFEKSPRKCQFLTTCAARWPNLSVAGPVPEGGDLAKAAGGKIDYAIARAFKPIRASFDSTRAYRRAGGRYVFYKARRAKIEEEARTAGIELMAAPEGDPNATGDAASGWPPEPRSKPANFARLLRLRPLGKAEERHLVAIGWPDDPLTSGAL